jgi:hypothetical protein
MATGEPQPGPGTNAFAQGVELMFSQTTHVASARPVASIATGGGDRIAGYAESSSSMETGLDHPVLGEKWLAHRLYRTPSKDAHVTIAFPTGSLAISPNWMNGGAFAT